MKKRYDSYKDSGVEWIGVIPSHWSKIKIKNTVDPNRKITYGIVQPGEEDPNGTLMIRGKDYSNGWVDVSEVFRVSPKIELPYSRSRVKSGDIVYTIVGGVGNVEIVPKEYEGSNLTQTTGRISIRDGINSKWVYHSLQSELNPVQIKLSQVGSVIPGISLDTLKNFIVLLPPLSEQQQIVSFLDNKTTLIDSLIEKTQRKIELLKEKRTSLINEVVTIGLNPNVEMKNSGVEWIGEIPSNWELKKLKHISDVRPSNVDKHIYEEEIQVHLCNYTDVYYNEVINSKTNLKRGSCNENEFEKFKLEKGDVIITKDSETPDDIGIPVYVEETLENVVCGYHLTMIKPISVTGKFIFRFIECDRTRRYFELSSNGVTRFGLGKSSIENLVLPIPPLPEQLQIVEYLDEHTHLIDNTISIEGKRIELLKEYRQSLISEVVTGKLKVTTDE